MWFLYLLAAILLLLCIPVYLSVEYDRFVQVSVRYLIRFKVLDTEKQEQKKKKKKQTVQKTETTQRKKPEEGTKKKGIKEQLSFLWEFLKSSKTGVAFFLRHLKISRLKLHLVITGADAAKTAVNYGKWCAGVYSSISLLKNWFSFGKIQIQILPDFEKNQNEYQATVTVRIIPMVVVIAAIQVLFSLLINMMKKQKEEQEYLNKQEF